VAGEGKKNGGTQGTCWRSTAVLAHKKKAKGEPGGEGVQPSREGSVSERARQSQTISSRKAEITRKEESEQQEARKSWTITMRIITQIG